MRPGPCLAVVLCRAYPGTGNLTCTTTASQSDDVRASRSPFLPQATTPPDLERASAMADGAGDAGPFLSLPPSPTRTRRQPAASQDRTASTSAQPDELSPLLQAAVARPRTRGHSMPRQLHLSRNQSYTGTGRAASPGAAASQANSPPPRRTGSIRSVRHHSRTGSWGQRLIQALSDRQESMAESKRSLFPDERVWYDQFTSTDWVHDSIADAYRVKALRSRTDIWGRIYVLFDGAQGWILSALVGFVVAVLAYTIDVSEAVAFDYKYGYCVKAWYKTERVSHFLCDALCFLSGHVAGRDTRH